MYRIDIISDRQICNLHGRQIDMRMIDRYVTDIDRKSNIVEKEKEG